MTAKETNEVDIITNKTIRTVKRTFDYATGEKSNNKIKEMSIHAPVLCHSPPSSSKIIDVDITLAKRQIISLTNNPLFICDGERVLLKKLPGLRYSTQSIQC